MRIRTIVTAILLLFVGASVVYLIASERRAGDVNTDRRDDSAAASNAVGNPTARREGLSGSAAHQVVAFYFHGNTRCPTCRAIEAYTEETLKNGFPDELRAGKLVWLVVNIEEPGNEHYINDYQLTTRSVVLVEMENGNENKWRRLDNVWQLVRDKDAFSSYISENTRSFLTGI
jgi:hypothetical protein